MRIVPLSMFIASRIYLRDPATVDLINSLDLLPSLSFVLLEEEKGNRSVSSSYASLSSACNR